jgi:hypothetical protein
MEKKEGVLSIDIYVFLDDDSDIFMKETSDHIHLPSYMNVIPASATAKELAFVDKLKRDMTKMDKASDSSILIHGGQIYIFSDKPYGATNDGFEKFHKFITDGGLNTSPATTVMDTWHGERDVQNILYYHMKEDGHYADNGIDIPPLVLGTNVPEKYQVYVDIGILLLSIVIIIVMVVTLLYIFFALLTLFILLDHFSVRYSVWYSIIFPYTWLYSMVYKRAP